MPGVRFPPKKKRRSGQALQLPFCARFMLCNRVVHVMLCSEPTTTPHPQFNGLETQNLDEIQKTLSAQHMFFIAKRVPNPQQVRAGCLHCILRSSYCIHLDTSYYFVKICIIRWCCISTVFYLTGHWYCSN